jgi:hypothetical protein
VQVSEPGEIGEKRAVLALQGNCIQTAHWRRRPAKTYLKSAEPEFCMPDSSLPPGECTLQPVQGHWQAAQAAREMAVSVQFARFQCPE